MFGFFKPAWKSSDPEKRLKALDKLNPNDASDIQILRELASKDEDLGVKLAALRRIDDRQALLAMYLEEQDSNLQKTLLASLFPADQSDKEAIDTAEAIANARNYNEMQRAQYALDVPAVAASEHFISGLQSEDAFMLIALKHKQANKRMAAAEHIQSRTALSTLLKESRDKQIHHYAKAKTKAFRQQELAVQAQQDKVRSVIEQIALLSKALDTRQYAQRLERIEEQWQSVREFAQEADLKEYATLQTHCQAQANTLAEQESAKHHAIVATQDQQQCIEHLQKLLDALTPETPHQDIEGVLHDVRQSWAQLSQNAPPQANAQKRYDELNRLAEQRVQSSMSLQEHSAELKAQVSQWAELPTEEAKLQSALSTLNQLLKRISWPKDWQTPGDLNEAFALKERLQAAIEALKTQKEKQNKKLFAQMAHVRRELKNGHLKYATRHFQDLESQIQALPERERQSFEGRIEGLREDLGKLRDWHDFTAEPHKQELCERMEALLTQDIAPDELAERVKAMRREWKEVTAANVIHDDPLWVRFNQAAEQAYAPCHDYFEKQNKVKKENLEKRRTLIQQLSQFVETVDWDQADWKLIEQAIRSARNEWRQYSPVHLQEAKADQKTFDQLIKRLQSPLDNERKQNRELRKQLIAEAQTLLSLEDTRQAIQKAKQFQNQWKAIGPTFQSDFHSQWRVFRSTLDQVFERRQEEQEVEKQALNEIKQNAEHILSQIESLPETLGHNLAGAKKQFDELQQAYDALPDMPQRLANGLNRRLSAASQQFMDFSESYPRRQILHHLEQAHQVCDACKAQEALPREERDIDTLRAQLAALKPPMSGCHFNALEQRIERLLSDATTEDKSAADERLADALIELEVLSDTSTPEAYREQRRQYQLQALQNQSHTLRHDLSARLVQGLLDGYGEGPLNEANATTLMNRLAAVQTSANKIILEEKS